MMERENQTMPTKAKRDLERPISGFWYFIIGVIAYIVFGGILLAIYSNVGNYLVSTYANNSVIGAFSLVLILIFYLPYGLVAAKGWRGQVTFLDVVSMMLLPLVPIIGQILAAYFSGKGIYMLVTRQNYVETLIAS